MMRITIIPENGFVSIDGEGFSGLDLSFVPSSVHAVQWYGEDGEVEVKDNKGRMVRNDVIVSIDPYQQALDAWQAAKDATEGAE